MSRVIDQFRGEYHFLSNFYPIPVMYEGQVYSSSEHAYMASKTNDLSQKQQIIDAKTPGEAKRLGRKATLRPDWEEVKYEVMWAILMAKFSAPDMRAKLIGTGDATLVEGNNWGDKYWGVDLRTGEGHNRLGEALMEVRDVLNQTYGYNLIVAGGREFNDYRLLSERLMLIADTYLEEKLITIVSGAARGADRLGEQFALDHDVRCISLPADWNTYGKRAGFLRNGQMAGMSQGLLAFWDGKSIGTEHMINTAHDRGLDVFLQMYGTKDTFYIPERFTNEELVPISKAGS